ncbi:MAG: Flp pilus assembly complex ATPase component TadA [Acidobacteriaceae bacterium]|nr:Flp pilus assembly complex ATPase component TadA [Acidobacteriaceae bacterium]
MLPDTESITLDKSSNAGTFDTNALLAAMLRVHDQVSDLIFSPGRIPQVQIHGELIAIQGSAVRALTADDTRHIASDLIGDNKHAISTLREQGSCDVSYGLPGVARFRVNIFIQRGSCAVVIRVIPTAVPTLTSLGLPANLQKLASLRDGVVLVTGSRNSGKSSTLAALLDCINQERVCHIITIEDPIEFLHNHKRATVHQRELHSDTGSVPLGLRAAMRQAPDVILVSELRERDSVEMAIEAAESGHLLFSSLNAPDQAKAIERMVGFFSVAEQEAIRSRLSRTLRCIISQRLLPHRDRSGRVAVVSASGLDAHSGQLTRDLMEHRPESRTENLDPMDAAIVDLVCAGAVDSETAITFASAPSQLRLALAKRASK